jgi:cytochrome c peroxidase
MLPKVTKMKTLHIFLLLVGVAAPAVSQHLPAPVDDNDYALVDLQEAKLGQLLFYDPVLSGNRETACATCHHPALGTSDGVSLSFGDGGIGMGQNRKADPNNLPEKRIPRNSPALFNLGAHEFTVLFHDGRLEADASRPGGIRTPMDADMVVGFTSVLSAQTMFPVLSRDEMAGSYNENEIGKLVRQGRITGSGGAWDVLARRVADIPEYASAFTATYSHLDTPSDIAFTDISNAIAAFVSYEWRSDTSRFDAVLRGTQQLSGLEQKGLGVFYADRGCADCHSGSFQTDHEFYVMAAPQIGPGKAATFEDHTRDDGRFRVTGRDADRFAFRTPSLRNIASTAPYGHAGAHADLSEFIKAHADPVRGLKDYDRSQVILPEFTGNDFALLDDLAQTDAITNAVKTAPINLSDGDITAIVAFLNTLTDPISKTGRLGVPPSVPSGLQVPTVD